MGDPVSVVTLVGNTVTDHLDTLVLVVSFRSGLPDGHTLRSNFSVSVLRVRTLNDTPDVSCFVTLTQTGLGTPGLGVVSQRSSTM